MSPIKTAMVCSSLRRNGCPGGTCMSWSLRASSSCTMLVALFVTDWSQGQLFVGEALCWIRLRWSRSSMIHCIILPLSLTNLFSLPVGGESHMPVLITPPPSAFILELGALGA